MVSIFISTPCYDAMMTMQYTISLLKLITFFNKNNIDYVIDFIGNESLIPRARNNSLHRFIKSNYTHLFFIDSDIEFEPNAFIELLEFDKDVVCGAYPRKGYNWKKLIYSLQNESNSNEQLFSRGLDFTFNPDYGTDGKIIKSNNFIKVIHASTGFMLIKRDIIEKLCDIHKELEIISDDMTQQDKTHIGLFHCIIVNKQYLSEDYSFCHRVNNAGGEVWINISNNINHVGKHIFMSDIKNRINYGRYGFERKFY